MRKISNKKGFTIPTALAFTLLLMALAAAILLVASYRYQKVYIRNQENQLYLYATALVEEHTNSIGEGKLNETVASVIEKSKDSGDPDLQVFAESYSFEMGLGATGTDTIDHGFIDQEIGYEMIVTYEPQVVGGTIPAGTEEYVKVGDRMKVEYHVSLNNIEYRITADYYCARNANLNSAGIPVASETYTNMRWELNQYTGQFYNTR